MGPSAVVTSDDQPSTRDQAYAVLQGWSRAAAGSNVHRLRAAVAHTVRGGDPVLLAAVERLLVDELSARVARAWEAGWEPRDLVHAASTSSRTGAHVRALVAVQAAAGGAVARAPQAWRDQLADLAPEDWSPGGSWRPVDPDASTSTRIRTFTDLLLLLKLLAGLRPLEPLGPSPSQWGRSPRSAATSTGSAGSGAAASTPGRDRLLTRIRGLLAKAEATDHPAEAETFTEKAQELMTRHAVDEAVLRGLQHEDVPVVSRRVHLQSPYANVKATLLNAVAEPNRCRTVLMSAYDIAVLVGTPTDVDQTELLFTSLLVQATRAMGETGHRGDASSDRSATFRRSFLLAYATRIGERLREADRSAAATFGTDLVPLLRREADAVDAEFDRQFPHVRQGGTTSVDVRGWEAGRAAADRASVAGGTSA
ncbi:DUF2786 domain-containing protein [Microlunatus flavus]|uniref:Uncharacterized protein n=1 Tax=Microlunatus flavus TaxID=1036181 RepID=A0A1H9L0L3_9ACTN|nr:DUF2786 domain-containing protein [Microlunatus flavus]SER04936.1 Protein of unknown function [Microlunatus flavus]